MSAPLDASDAVAALLAINAEDKPYRLAVEPADPAAPNTPVVVSARWKVADVRWKSALGGGSYRFDYWLEVFLDASSGTYRFVEHEASDKTSVGLSPAGLHAQKESSRFRGKTFGQRSSKVIVSQKVTSADAGGEHEGAAWTTTFRPTDVKEPVFEALRGLGWRPPHDSWWSRVWER